MNGFRKLQKRLTEEGWYVGWNLPCCQSCAWAKLPDEFEDGTEIDFHKVLFNHSQDCEVEYDYEDCEECQGKGCDTCEGEGCIMTLLEEGQFDESASGFICHTPDQQDDSAFCFSGSKEGVKNLKEIIPIIEECGCTIKWNKKGDSRPTISWGQK